MDNYDIERTIDELHIYEKKILNSLELSSKSTSPEEIADSQKLDIKSVMSAAGSLASKDIIKVTKEIEEILSLSEDGKICANEGLPERKILKLLQSEGNIHMNELQDKFNLNSSDVKIGVGWLVRKKWAKIDKGVLNITDFGQEFLDLGNDEKLLELLLDNKEFSLNKLDSTLIDGYKLLKSRKNLINIDKNTFHFFYLTNKGKKIINKGIAIQKEATQLTHEHLKLGQWKNLKYRSYNINTEFPEFNPGKIHPLRRTIDEIKEVFLNLGFSEARGPTLESAFWNFDSLFQPQDHAAREMQDTFYIKNPKFADLPKQELVNKVAKTHEDGGNTSSEGWNYKWDIEVAKQTVLRTHTTGVSVRHLYDNEPPLKMFSVGRVFRRETITYKHLPEFHQVEGIVASKDVNFKNLLGIIKEFYKKLGFKVRFRPAYFPYTYLSMECEIYLPEKESWIELGGSGMFRPEVLEPLGINTPVAAFGLGIERLTMIKLGITDIRMLYKSDIGWLRKLPITNGLNTGKSSN